MEKIFYNKDGWVCNRYPYNINIDDENRFIEVSDQEYSGSLATAAGYAWRVVDGKLVNEVYDSEIVAELEREEEIRRLESWFSEIYDIQTTQYARDNRLYGESKIDIAKYDKLAVENAKKLKELRKKCELYQGL